MADLVQTQPSIAWVKTQLIIVKRFMSSGRQGQASAKLDKVLAYLDPSLKEGYEWKIDDPEPPKKKVVTPIEPERA